MRVSDKMNFNQVTRTMNDARGEVAHLQTQAATGKSLLKPSDNPVAAARVLAARSNLAGTEQYIKNNQAAQNFLQFTDQALDELTSIFMRAKELALSQANDPSSSPQAKRMVAREVNQLLDQAIGVGNRRFGDRYIFGGFQTTEQPFNQNGNYMGDDGDIIMEVGKGQYMAMNIPGSKVFLGKEFQTEPVKGQRSLENTPAKSFDTDVMPMNGPLLRGPSSVNNEGEMDEMRQQFRFAQGANVLRVLKNFWISLEAGDTYGVQKALDEIDIAQEQIVSLRAQVGARMNAVSTNLDSLEKDKLENRVMISQFEDADAFQVYSDLKKSEGNLQASLQTSGRLIQPSLLDFLR